MSKIYIVQKRTLKFCLGTENKRCLKKFQWEFETLYLRCPLSKLRNKLVENTAVETKKVLLKWKRENHIFEGNELLPEEIPKLNTSYNLFCHFFAKDILNEIIRQTCLYSTQVQPNRHFSTSSEEIQHFMRKT